MHWTLKLFFEESFIFGLNTGVLVHSGFVLSAGTELCTCQNNVVAANQLRTWTAANTKDAGSVPNRDDPGTALLRSQFFP